MKYNLEKDLEKVEFFFNMRAETHEGFVSKLIFDINSNSYVRILQEAIDKKSFAGYKIYTDIEMVVNSETNKINYKLNVSFDRIY
jgi:hypothetical protein